MVLKKKEACLGSSTRCYFQSGRFLPAACAEVKGNAPQGVNGCLKNRERKGEGETEGERRKLALLRPLCTPKCAWQLSRARFLPRQGCATGSAAIEHLMYAAPSPSLPAIYNCQLRPDKAMHRVTPSTYLIPHHLGTTCAHF